MGKIDDRDANLACEYIWSLVDNFADGMVKRLNASLKKSNLPKPLKKKKVLGYINFEVLIYLHFWVDVIMANCQEDKIRETVFKHIASNIFSKFKWAVTGCVVKEDLRRVAIRRVEEYGSIARGEIEPVGLASLVGIDSKDDEITKVAITFVDNLTQLISEGDFVYWEGSYENKPLCRDIILETIISGIYLAELWPLHEGFLTIIEKFVSEQPDLTKWDLDYIETMQKDFMEE